MATEEMDELHLAHRQGDVNEISSEAADVLIFLYAYASEMGFNLDEAVKTKLALNQARYPAKDFQSGDYQEKRTKCKQEWKQMRADEWFEP
jgi:hypothetical protein